MDKKEIDEAMAYLDEKIALATKNHSWEGVDVDAFIDEIRGRESEEDVRNAPECIYGRTYEERLRVCKFCSAACGARVE